jgi:hypothetical protein
MYTSLSTNPKDFMPSSIATIQAVSNLVNNEIIEPIRRNGDGSYTAYGTEYKDLTQTTLLQKKLDIISWYNKLYKLTNSDDFNPHILKQYIKTEPLDVKLITFPLLDAVYQGEIINYLEYYCEKERVYINKDGEQLIYNTLLPGLNHLNYHPNHAAKIGDICSIIYSAFNKYAREIRNYRIKPSDGFEVLVNIIVNYSELAVKHNWVLKTYSRPKQLKSLMTSFTEQLLNINDIYQFSIGEIQDTYTRIISNDV